jgi:hypothetical protein
LAADLNSRTNRTISAKREHVAFDFIMTRTAWNAIRRSISDRIVLAIDADADLGPTAAAIDAWSVDDHFKFLKTEPISPASTSRRRAKAGISIAHLIAVLSIKFAPSLAAALLAADRKPFLVTPVSIKACAWKGLLAATTTSRRWIDELRRAPRAFSFSASHCPILTEAVGELSHYFRFSLNICGYSIA